MFDDILTGLIVIGIVIGITIKLKTWPRRISFLVLIFIITPLALYCWFKLGYYYREQELKEAQAACREQKTIKQLNIIFSGFEPNDIKDNCRTIHKNANGKVLDSGMQHIDTSRYDDGSLSINYNYKHTFQANDIIEITIGGKVLTLSNFVQTASANYNMGGPVINGCRIDIADINGKRTAWDQNMIIHKTDLK